MALSPPTLQALLDYDVRAWSFLAEPLYRITDAGYTVVLNSPMMRVATATGANKGVEYYEYMHHNIYGSTLGGADWLDNRQLVKCWVTGITATNPAGEAFAGIELGSLKCHAPFGTNWNANGLASTQLRWNATTQKWEFMIYDCDAVAPTVEECSVQPANSFLNPIFELLIDYRPGVAIDCYIHGQLVHSYSGPRLANFQANASGADGGGGIFVTSGSNAAGKMQAEFTAFKAITVGKKARA